MATGKNKVPMAELRGVLERAGFKNVRTYIQSGNALVGTTLSAREVEQQVHEHIKNEIGPDLVVVVRTGTELQRVLDNNPFEKGYDRSRVFFVLFAEKPPPQKVKELLAQDFGDEKLAVIKDAAYMYIPGTYGRGKLSNNFLEKKLGAPSKTFGSFISLDGLAAIVLGPKVGGWCPMA